MAPRGFEAEFGAVSNGSDVEFTWVDSTSSFQRIVEELLTCDRYAIDTEFHRERTYFPALALVQLGWGDGNIVLVDPTSVDLAPLRQLFESDVEAVFHAAQQDLDVLTHAVAQFQERCLTLRLRVDSSDTAHPLLRRS